MKVRIDIRCYLSLIIGIDVELQRMDVWLLVHLFLGQYKSHPYVFRSLVLHTLHYSNLSGQMDERIMYDCIKREYYWPGMAHNVHTTNKDYQECPWNDHLICNESFYNCFQQAISRTFCIWYFGATTNTLDRTQLVMVMTYC